MTASGAGIPVQGTGKLSVWDRNKITLPLARANLGSTAVSKEL